MAISKNEPIFITGGTGFIGSYILRYLVHSGYSNIYALKRSGSSMELLDEKSKLVQWIEGDILDHDSLKEGCLKGNVIIHCAGIVSFDRRDRNLMLRVNYEGTRDLINIALESDIKRFIHISSISTLGRTEDVKLIDEQSTFANSKYDTKYAFSKFLGEMEVWRGGAEGLDVAMLNPTMVLGSGFWDSGTPKIFKQVKQGVPFYPKGCNAYVDVRDVARMTVELMNSNISGERFICTAEGSTQKEFLTLIAKNLNKKPPRLPFNQLIGALAIFSDWIRCNINGSQRLITRETLRVAGNCFKYNNSKSREMLGFEYTPIEQTIEETAFQFLEASKNNYNPLFLPFK